MPRLDQEFVFLRQGGLFEQGSALRQKWSDLSRTGNRTPAQSLGERGGKQQEMTLETRAAHLGIWDVNE